VNSSIVLKKEKLNADIVVIGGGGCGMAAAISGREKGAKKVILLEARALGGNTALAHGLFAAESDVQKSMGISTTKEECFRAAMDHAHWEINPRLFRAFVNKSADTIHWLEEKGLKISQVIGPPGGIQTWHIWTPGGAPPEILRVLSRSCRASGVQIFTHCPAKKILINEQGKAIGVTAVIGNKEIQITARSVIIATGGYGANKELLKKYYRNYSDRMVYAGVPNTGDGLLMATEIGAATEGLGNLLLHPPFYNGSRYTQLFTRGVNHIWLNKRGERFTDERDSSISNVIAIQPDTCIYPVFDEKVKNSIIEEAARKREWTGFMAGAKIPDLNKELEIEAETGDVKISNSWDEIARWMGVRPEVVKTTIEEYNVSCDKGRDEIFGTNPKFLQALRNPPYYALRCHMHFLTTIGGIKINHHMEVIDTRENIIPGLYAGGDTAGGWETATYCTALPGHAIAFAINSGRIAGENAAQYVSGK